jgi:alpha-soluble NSF attachment protein
MPADADTNKAQAEQKVKGGFLRCFAGIQRFEEAIELYEQAANQYKQSKQWPEAADCMLQSALCAAKCSDPKEEARFYQEAGNLCKRFSSRKATEYKELAAGMYKQTGQLVNAAKLYKEIAEMFESEEIDYVETLRYYQMAADMFDLDEHSKSNMSTCTIKIAEYSAKSGDSKDLQQAIKIFETEGAKALKNNLTQYNAKEHYFRAGILHLSTGDTVMIKIALDKYGCEDPRFAGSREGDLLNHLSIALETHDVELFEEKLQDYNSATNLDAWKIEFLLKAKNHLQLGGDFPSLDGADGMDLT